MGRLQAVRLKAQVTNSINPPTTHGKIADSLLCPSYCLIPPAIQLSPTLTLFGAVHPMWMLRL